MGNFLASIISPFEEILKFMITILHGGFSNYGVIIILLTIIIKMLLLPLTLKQDKSMRAMKKIQPEMDSVREKYKDNPQEMNKAVMELYQKHNVNPFGGCLPVLLQLPILWALFNVIKNPVIIPKDAHFLIFSLQAKDSLYILPVLNALIAFLQQKIMNIGGKSNPQMEMMTYIFPVMMFAISFSMPAGLQIYWITSSAISVLQQYLINKWATIKEEKIGKSI
mgnify:CR=1 FL=1